MVSPFTFLTFRYLEGNLGPGTSRDAADLAGQELEIHLDETAKGESELFENYVDLTAGELDALAPHIHEWFLERMILQPTLVSRERLVPVLVHAFFLDSSPTLPYLVVSGLIASSLRREDRWSEEAAPGIVLPVIRAAMESIDPDARLDQLAEILLDLYCLIPEGVESTGGRQALLELSRAPGSQTFTGRFREALKERADQLTGEKRAALEALLREGGGLSR